MKRLCAFLMTCGVLAVAWGPLGARLAEAQGLSVKLSLKLPVGGTSASITHVRLTNNGNTVGESGATLVVAGDGEATASISVPVTAVPDGLELRFAVPCHICTLQGPDGSIVGPGTLTTYVVLPASFAFDKPFFFPFDNSHPSTGVTVIVPPDIAGDTDTDTFFELSLVEVIETTAPTCQVTSDRTTIVFTVRDGESGLKTITVSRARNAHVVVDPFTPGTTAPVHVTATRIDPTRSMSVSLKVTDVVGNTVFCARSVW